jgi:hypothetical protein
MFDLTIKINIIKCLKGMIILCEIYVPMILCGKGSLKYFTT